MSQPFSSSTHVAAPKTTTISTTTTPITKTTTYITPRSATATSHPLLSSASSWARAPRRAAQGRWRHSCFIFDNCYLGPCSRIQRSKRCRNARACHHSFLFSLRVARSPTAKQTNVDAPSEHASPTPSVPSASSSLPSSLLMYTIGNKMETSSIARGSEAASKQKSMAAVYLGLFLASSSCMVVSATPAPAPAPQAQSPPNAASKFFEPLAAAAADPAAVTVTTTAKVTTVPVTTNSTPSTRPTTTTTNAPATQTTQSTTTTTATIASTTVSATTTTTTTSTSFSDNVITVTRTTSDSNQSSSSRGISPSGTPYGTIRDDNTNGGMMLIVSLVVVFVVLAVMGLVVCCLFRRRNAKNRRMHLFGGGSGKGPNSTSSSSSGLDNILAAAVAGHPGDGIKGPRDSTGGLHTPVGGTTGDALQEMSELHQSALLSRKSSTLSMRSGFQGPSHGQSGSHQGNHMLSPVLAPARPYSHASGHWSGSTNNNYGPGDYISSDPGSMDHPSFSQAREFRNSQYDEYYGVAPPQPLYALEGSGSSKVRGGSSSGYSSNEQLVPPHHPHSVHHHSGHSSLNISRRSSLSPGLHPQSDTLHSSSPLFRAKTLGNASGGTYQQQQNQHPYYGPASLSASQILHGDSGIPIAMSGIEDSSGSEPSESVSESPLAVQGEQGMIRPKSMSLPHGPAPSHADLRPQSMMILGNALPPPSNLIIPPSITTRPRSMLNPSAIYASQAQSQSQGQYQQQHPHPYYQQQQQQRYYPAPQDYYYQQYPVSPALYPSAHGTPTMTHEVAVAEDDSEYAAAAGVGSSSGSGSGSGIGSASNDGTESEQLMSKEVGKRPSESSLSTPSSPSHTVPESNDASASDGSA